MIRAERGWSRCACGSNSKRRMSDFGFRISGDSVNVASVCGWLNASEILLLTFALLCTASAQTPLFQTMEEAPIGDRFGGPLSVAVGDFNGDGVPDLVVADSEGAQLVVHLGAGGGRSQPG